MKVNLDQPNPPAKADPRFAAIEALRADGPDPERLPGLMLFGQFVGEWLMEVSFFQADGRLINSFKADWVFSWILQGRAIQDVLMSPQPRRTRGQQRPRFAHRPQTR